MATARRRVDEVNGHRSFVQGLLTTLARGQLQAGAQQSGQAEGTATALQNVPFAGEAAHQSAALQARWAMGRDSAAYLRTDVVPLQSSGRDENAVHPDVVTNGIYPEVERAGRVGMLEHMGAELERRRTTLIGELVQHTQLIGYLLQIDEVRDAVKWRLLTMASLDAEAGAQALQCLLSVTENRGGNVAVQALSDFARRPVQVDAQETEQRQAQRKAIRLLAQELLLVLGAPLAEAERQLERTLHGEMGELAYGLRRMAAVGSQYEPAKDALQRRAQRVVQAVPGLFPLFDRPERAVGGAPRPARDMARVSRRLMTYHAKRRSFIHETVDVGAGANSTAAKLVVALQIFVDRSKDFFGTTAGWSLQPAENVQTQLAQQFVFELENGSPEDTYRRTDTLFAKQENSELMTALEEEFGQGKELEIIKGALLKVRANNPKKFDLAELNAFFDFPVEKNPYFDPNVAVDQPERLKLEGGVTEADVKLSEEAVVRGLQDGIDVLADSESVDAFVTAITGSVEGPRNNTSDAKALRLAREMVADAFNTLAYYDGNTSKYAPREEHQKYVLAVQSLVAYRSPSETTEDGVAKWDIANELFVEAWSRMQPALQKVAGLNQDLVASPLLAYCAAHMAFADKGLHETAMRAYGEAQWKKPDDPAAAFLKKGEPGPDYGSGPSLPPWAQDIMDGVVKPGEDWWAHGSWRFYAVQGVANWFQQFGLEIAKTWVQRAYESIFTTPLGEGDARGTLGQHFTGIYKAAIAQGVPQEKAQFIVSAKAAGLAYGEYKLYTKIAKTAWYVGQRPLLFVGGQLWHKVKGFVMFLGWAARAAASKFSYGGGGRSGAPGSSGGDGGDGGGGGGGGGPQILPTPVGTTPTASAWVIEEDPKLCGFDANVGQGQLDANDDVKKNALLAGVGQMAEVPRPWTGAREDAFGLTRLPGISPLWSVRPTDSGNEAAGVEPAQPHHGWFHWWLHKLYPWDGAQAPPALRDGARTNNLLDALQNADNAEPFVTSRVTNPNGNASPSWDVNIASRRDTMFATTKTVWAEDRPLQHPETTNLSRTDGRREVLYAVARGICGLRGAHQDHLDVPGLVATMFSEANDIPSNAALGTLVYTLPTSPASQQAQQLVRTHARAGGHDASPKAREAHDAKVQSARESARRLAEIAGIVYQGADARVPTDTTDFVNARGTMEVVMPTEGLNIARVQTYTGFVNEKTRAKFNRFVTRWGKAFAAVGTAVSGMEMYGWTNIPMFPAAAVLFGPLLLKKLSEAYEQFRGPGRVPAATVAVDPEPPAQLEARNPWWKLQGDNGAQVEGIYARVDPVRIVRWLPSIRPEGAAAEGAPAELDIRDQHVQAVCRASVLEHLVDYYGSVARAEHVQDGLLRTQTRTAALLARAATKLLQLPELAHMSTTEAQPVLIRMRTLDGIGDCTDGEKLLMLTRPVVRCPNGRVLYPCDAGIAQFRVQDGGTIAQQGEPPEAPAPPDNLDLGQFDATVDWNTSLLDESWTEITTPRAGATRALRYMLRRPTAYVEAQEAIDPDLKPSDDGHPPLYVARPVETFVGTDPDPRDVLDTPSRLTNVNRVFQGLSKESLAPDVLRVALVDADRLCRELEALDCEEEYVRKEQAALQRGGRRDPDCPDDDPNLSAVSARRSALWNDSLRQLAISNDRLYAFVQHLTGTISEAVDAVAVIDDSMLVEAERRTQDARRRAAERAAAVQLQVVRGVLANVFKDSGLALQFGDNQEMKVSASAVRKQAQAITQQAAQQGIFTASVDMDRLLAGDGGADISLADLMRKLNQVGAELSRSALVSVQPTSGAGAGASLDFLGAPRNSLLLRWKPEAKAAIRRAYDIFCHELQGQHHCTLIRRTPAAFELMEGVNDQLCNQFAQLVGHVLVASRMSSPAYAPYLNRGTLATNGKQIRLELEKLVRLWHVHVTRFPMPNFAGERRHYFNLH